jgi:GNAT superfamily N-acetyltransferase
MLQGSVDFPQNLLYLYERRGSPLGQTYVAWDDGAIGGVLTGSFSVDLVDLGTFDAFDIPAAPHAILERVHVHERHRRQGAGRDLIETFVSDASWRGCSFIGGWIDVSSDSRERAAFFESLGFTIFGSDQLGADPIDVLSAIQNR